MSLFLSSIEPHKYQLRAYVYQARDLIPSDSSGMSGMHWAMNVFQKNMISSIIMLSLSALQRSICSCIIRQLEPGHCNSSTDIVSHLGHDSNLRQYPYLR